MKRRFRIVTIDDNPLPNSKYHQKQKARTQESPQLTDVSKYVWLTQHNVSGAKSAYRELKEAAVNMSDIDVRHLLNSKGYQIMSGADSIVIDSVEEALVAFKHYDISHMRARRLLCAILPKDCYLFFWEKSVDNA